MYWKRALRTNLNWLLPNLEPMERQRYWCLNTQPVRTWSLIILLVLWRALQAIQFKANGAVVYILVDHTIIIWCGVVSNTQKEWSCHFTLPLAVIFAGSGNINNNNQGSLEVCFDFTGEQTFSFYFIPKRRCLTEILIVIYWGHRRDSSQWSLWGMISLLNIDHSVSDAKTIVLVYEGYMKGLY
jgi:hypothetical protein